MTQEHAAPAAEAIRKAVVRAYDAATHKATVQLVGSHPTLLTSIRVATNIPAADVVVGRQCTLLFLDPANQADAVVLTIQGAVPSTPGGGGGAPSPHGAANHSGDTIPAADQDFGGFKARALGAPLVGTDAARQQEITDHLAAADPHAVYGALAQAETWAALQTFSGGIKTTTISNLNNTLAIEIPGSGAVELKNFPFHFFNTTVLITGGADAVQLRVKAFPAQTLNVFEVQDASAASVFGVNTNGNGQFAGTLGVTGLLTASGHIKLGADGQIQDTFGTARILFGEFAPNVHVIGNFYADQWYGEQKLNRTNAYEPALCVNKGDTDPKASFQARPGDATGSAGRWILGFGPPYDTMDVFVWRLASNALTLAADGGTQPRLLIGANAAPAPSALLELQSTVGALLLTRLTTTQRDALTPVNGMLVYNSTLDKLQGYEAGAWVSLV